jgi:hypothetical protein
MGRKGALMDEKFITTGLGVAALGLGCGFATLPGFINKLTGLNLPTEMEGRLVIRILGMRDITLGAGLLLQRDIQEQARFWRKAMAFNAATDVILFGFALPKSRNKLKTLMGVGTSAVVTYFCLKDIVYI